MKSSVPEVDQKGKHKDDKINGWIKARRRSKIIGVIQFFLLGTEFSLVIPTLGFYLQQLQVKDVPFMYGLICAAYNVLGVIFALILSRTIDKTLKFSLTVSVVNGITLIGNVLYVVGNSPYLLLSARALNGIVESTFPVFYGELARCYSSKEFPRHAGHLMTAYVLGMTISPVFNLLPNDVTVTIGALKIRYTNAPGAILFCLYLVQLMITATLLPNISLEKQRLGIDVENLNFQSEGKSDTTYQSYSATVHEDRVSTGKENVFDDTVLVAMKNESQPLSSARPIYDNHSFSKEEDEETFLVIEKEAAVGMYKYGIYRGGNVIDLLSSGTVDSISIRNENDGNFDRNIVVSTIVWWKLLANLLKRKEILVLFYGQAVWAYTLVTGILMLPNVGIVYLHLSHQQVSGYLMGLCFVLVLVMWTSSRLLVKYGPVSSCIAGFLLNFAGAGFLMLVDLSTGLSRGINFTLFFVYAVGYFVGWVVNSVAIRSTLSLHVAQVDQAFAQGLFTLVEQTTGIVATVSFGLAFHFLKGYCAWTMLINIVAVSLFSGYHSRLALKSSRL